MSTKHLCNSDSDFVKLWSDNHCPEEVENILGIEFPFTDGTYLSDVPDENEDFDFSQMVDRSTFRKTEGSLLPEKYPCVVVRFSIKGYDRMGFVRIEDFEIMYLDDFEVSVEDCEETYEYGK